MTFLPPARKSATAPRKSWSLVIPHEPIRERSRYRELMRGSSLAARMASTRSWSSVSLSPSPSAPAIRLRGVVAVSCSTISPRGATTSAAPRGTLGPPRTRAATSATSSASRSRLATMRREVSSPRQKVVAARTRRERGFVSMWVPPGGRKLSRRGHRGAQWASARQSSSSEIRAGATHSPECWWKSSARPSPDGSLLVRSLFTIGSSTRFDSSLFFSQVLPRCTR